jgi:hypothetical protein
LCVGLTTARRKNKIILLQNVTQGLGGKITGTIISKALDSDISHTALKHEKKKNIYMQKNRVKTLFLTLGFCNWYMMHRIRFEVAR